MVISFGKIFGRALVRRERLHIYVHRTHVNMLIENIERYPHVLFPLGLSRFTVVKDRIWPCTCGHIGAYILYKDGYNYIAHYTCIACANAHTCTHRKTMYLTQKGYMSSLVKEESGNI